MCSSDLNPMAALREVEKNPVMKQPFFHHARTDTGRIQDVDALMLEHPRTHAAFDVIPTPGLQHHALDPALVQKVSQQQARRTGTDDRNLGTHGS